MAAALIARPLLSEPMVHDSFWIDYVWARQFNAELGAGILYPRWLPDSFGGLGAPVFYFYPPAAFYLTALFDLAGAATYTSIILAFGVSFWVSGVGAYLLFRQLGYRPLLGAALFVLAPYHLLDFTLRGALAESVAIALLPFLAIGLKRIADGRSWLFAALSYALMILTHVPLALLASIFLIAPFAIARRRRLVPIGYATLVGIGLAAIYLIPAIALAGYRDEAQLFNEPRLVPSYWSLYGGHWDDNFFVAIHLVTASIAIPAALFAVRHRDARLIYALAMCALAAGLIPFVWSLPLIDKVQFSFRALPFAELALAAYIADRSTSLPKLRYALLLPAMMSALILIVTIPPETSLAQLDRDKPDVPEYLPPGVLDARPRLGEWPDLRIGRLPVPDRGPGTIVEPIFYFPMWSCGQIDEPTKLLAHPANCQPQRVRTAAEIWGSLISALSVLLFAACWLVGRRSRASARL